MKIMKVGVKYPELGIPPSVDGIEVRPLVVEVEDGVAALVGLGVAEIVAGLVGVGEAVAEAEVVAVKAGKVLCPEAKTINL